MIVTQGVLLEEEMQQRSSSSTETSGLVTSDLTLGLGKTLWKLQNSHPLFFLWTLLVKREWDPSIEKCFESTFRAYHWTTSKRNYSIYILKAATCLTESIPWIEKKNCPLPFSKTWNLWYISLMQIFFGIYNQSFAITYKPHLYSSSPFHFFVPLRCFFFFILRIIIVSSFIIIKEPRRLKS